MDILGDTLEQIAWQKGGICKPGHPAFTVPQNPGPLQTLIERAKELKVIKKKKKNYFLGQIMCLILTIIV